MKDDIAFCCAILYTNDVDYSVARHLASRIVEEKPFRNISEETLRAAKAEVDRCRLVIDASVEISESNRRLQELLDYASLQGKLCPASEYKGRIEKW